MQRRMAGIRKGAFTAVKRCSVLKKVHVCERVRVPIANKRYEKGVPFLTNMVCKRGQGLGSRGGTSPYKTTVSAPGGRV